MKATSLKLCKRMSIEQVFQAITVHCMAQIQANGAVLRKAHDVTGLHQMRVGVRRLRSALAAFKDVLRIPEEIHQELDWLAAPLGAARDWDVLTGSTLPAVVRELGDDIQAADVLLAVRERSSVMHAAVTALVNSERYARLMLSFTRWVTGRGWREGMSPEDLERLESPGATYGRDLLTHHQHRLLKHGGKLHAAEPKACHRLRIAAKKMRYATEFFQSFFPAKQVQSYVEALSTLQDGLGRLQDAAVADRLLMEVRDERPDLGPDIEWIRKHLAPHIKGDDLKIRKELKKCASIKFLG